MTVSLGGLALVAIVFAVVFYIFEFLKGQAIEMIKSEDTKKEIVRDSKKDFRIKCLTFLFEYLKVIVMLIMTLIMFIQISN